MPAKASKHLFHLVKSLSKSEWTALRRFKEAEVYNPGKRKGKESQVYEMIELLKEMADYNEDALRLELGLNDSKKDIQIFKNLKIYAEEKVLEAIQYAPENQTEEFRIQKLPNLLEHLLNRGAFFRARKLLLKYLPLVREYEMFEVELQLAEYQKTLAHLNSPAKDLQKELSEIQNRNRQVHKSILEVLELGQMREQVRGIVRNGGKEKEARLARIRKELQSWKQPYQSTKAQIYSLDIRSHLALHSREMEQYWEHLNTIYSIYQSSPSKFHSTALFRFVAYVRFAFIMDRTTQSDAGLCHQMISETLQSAKKLPSIRANLVRQQMAICKIHLAYRSGAAREMDTAQKEADQFFDKHPHLVGSRWYDLYNQYAICAGFVEGRWDTIFPRIIHFRTAQPNPHKPLYTHIAHLLNLLVRYEQGDSDGLEYELTLSRTYFKRHAPEHPLWKLFQGTGKKVLRGKTKWTDAAFLSELKSHLEAPEMAAYENYFPFVEWARADLKEVPLGDLLRPGN